MLCRLRLLIGLLRVFFVRSSVKSKIQRGLMNICPKIELDPKWQPLKIHDLPQSRRHAGEVPQCFSFERGRSLREKRYPSAFQMKQYITYRRSMPVCLEIVFEFNLLTQGGKEEG